MTGANIVLLASVALGALFAAVFCWRADGGLVRLAVKTASTALLAVWAWMMGGPVLLAAGLALSSLGDFFLAADENDKYLLPGMAAFFAAHVAYVALFWDLPPAGGTWLIPAAQAGLALGGVLYVRWLSPSLGDMRLPVFAYTGIILLMGVLALRLDPHYVLVTIGAMMFVASDMILARQLCARPKGGRPLLISSLLVWGLSFSGQALIAVGVVHPFVTASQP